jgi:hypothetical protein
VEVEVAAVVMMGTAEIVEMETMVTEAAETV